MWPLPVIPAFPALRKQRQGSPGANWITEIWVQGRDLALINKANYNERRHLILTIGLHTLEHSCVCIPTYMRTPTHCSSHANQKKKKQDGLKLLSSVLSSYCTSYESYHKHHKTWRSKGGPPMLSTQHPTMTRPAPRQQVKTCTVLVDNSVKPRCALPLGHNKGSK